MTRRKAFLTGITGQDGSYLAELLLAKGYEVHGLVRSSAGLKGTALESVCPRSESGEDLLKVHTGDIQHPEGLRRIVEMVAPHEVYHLAGATQAGASFQQSHNTFETIASAGFHLLEILQELPRVPRLFFASTSEVFGSPETSPQDELTPFRPRNPYGAAKAYVTQMIRIYREHHGLPWCSGILYNHESPRRGTQFVTRKITRAAAAISLGLQEELVLGDLKSQRDWGDAREYVHAMWKMVLQETPSDYVLATGKLHSVQDVLDAAFGVVQLDWHRYVHQDPRWVRPAESIPLMGNPARAEAELGWKAATPFPNLIADMVQTDLEELRANPGIVPPPLS